MAVAVAAGRLKTYANFVKLEHTIFSLPLIYAGALLGSGLPAAPGAAQAGGWPSARLLVLILLAAVGGRVAAMGLNRLIDEEIDRQNPRTRMRELPAGAMQRWEGRLVVALGSVVYVVSAAVIAPLCLILAPIPLVLFVAYPYLKRLTSLSHLGLGLAWSMAPLGGWLAATQSLARLDEVIWLWLFSLLWVSGFDIIYATMDETFDREAGLHALPASISRKAALRIAAILHAAAFLALYALWNSQLHSALALLWLIGIGALLIWQHAVAERKPEFAFFQLNGIIGFLVLGFVLAGLHLLSLG